MLKERSEQSYNFATDDKFFCFITMKKSVMNFLSFPLPFQPDA